MEKKKITTVYVEERILEDIGKNPSIKNLSEWINKEYPKQNFNLQREITELEILNREVEEKKERISRLQEREKQKQYLSSAATKFIQEEIPNRIHRGFQLKNILPLFNNEYGYDLTLKQLKNYVELINKKE